MTISIVKIWTPSPNEWDDAWLRCPYSTYFQSREWAEIWADYRPDRFSPDSLGIKFCDTTRLILPFSRERIFSGGASRHVSSLGGTFGGWLADFSLPEQHQKILLKLVVERYPNLIWRSNPFEIILAEGIFGRSRADETHVVDLRKGFQECYRNWKKEHVRAAIKARKAGVMITTASTVEEWREYFNVYQDSLRRWGERATSRYPWSFFDIAFRKKSPNIKLWLAKYDDRIIAGALCFYSSTHAVYWHGAALSSHFYLRPVNLLMYEAIHDAALMGSKWFDFNPSGNLVGVKEFKRKFGALPLNCDVHELSSLPVRIIGRLKQLAERSVR